MLIVILFTFGQSTAKITGKITGADNKPVASASIKIVGKTGGTTSNVDGNFTLVLETGKKYEIEVSAIGFTTKRINEIELTDIVIKSSSSKKESVNALISYQKNANTVAQRVPGLSVIDGKYLVVRGLADRYNQAMLNGVLLGSTEPDRKTFSFDIFPSSIIDNIIINKAFIPEMSGEWAGGLIQVNTNDVPSSNFFDIGFGTGFNTQTFGNDFYKYKGGKMDWLGFDDGTRALPDALPLKSDFNNLSQLAKTQYAKDFKNIWSTYKAPNKTVNLISRSYKLSAGFTKNLGTKNKLAAYKAKLHWFGSFQILDQYIPDQRRLQYNQDDPSDPTSPYSLLIGASKTSQKSGSRFYGFLSDYNYTTGADIAKTFTVKGLQQTVKAGYFFQVKDRLFDSRPFAIYLPTDNPTLRHLTQDVVFNAENFGNGTDNKFAFNEISDPRYRYLANSILNAGFLQLDNQLLKNKLRIVWGVRVEDYDQLIGSTNPKDPRYVNIKKTDFLPGATVTGNPTLERTKVTNADLRYELYKRPGELFTVGVFYKYFQSPTELYFNNTGAGSSGTFNYISPDNANSFGTEPMQGQSPYLINLGLQYDIEKLGLNTTLLFNQIGKRIYYVGGSDVPPVWEAPRPLLDLQIAKKVLKNKGEIKLNISDIINQEAKFYHDLNDNAAAVGLLTTTSCRKIVMDGNTTTTTTTTENTILEGRIITNLTLKASNVYKLRGLVYVTNGAILTIEPGTKIVGEFGKNGALIICRGAKIIADGTADKPIVFTSEAAIPQRGDWAGVVILGNAPTNSSFNGTAGIGEIEGGINNSDGLGLYGLGASSNVADNSGILRYVRIEYAGYAFLPDKEIKCLQLTVPPNHS
ncbi:unnamed protein product, partial [Rotaria sp. Silwood1]